MRVVATKKVIGGKLLRVKTQFEKVVESVQLTGDFFLHPEEAVELLEKSLVGLPVDSDRELFLKKLHTSIQETGVELVGVSPDDIINTFLETLQNK